MPISIEGVAYYTVAELSERLGITRQTLWRWRRAGKVPKGRRFRGGNTLFTEFEMKLVREFANNVEPIEPTSPDQLRLFNGVK